MPSTGREAGQQGRAARPAKRLLSAWPQVRVLPGAPSLRPPIGRAFLLVRCRLSSSAEQLRGCRWALGRSRRLSGWGGFRPALGGCSSRKLPEVSVRSLAVEPLPRTAVRGLRVRHKHRTRPRKAGRSDRPRHPARPRLGVPGVTADGRDTEAQGSRPLSRLLTVSRAPPHRLRSPAVPDSLYLGEMPAHEHVPDLGAA